MTTSSLLLELSGPMQSWGNSSNFSVRGTEAEPSKSGVLGLIAAAEGRRRTDPLEDLAELRFAVRVDQPGSHQRDYQTATNQAGATKLIERFYLADAVFVAAVEGPTEVLKGIEHALARPRYPLFLGRRSCPAPAKLVVGLRKTDAVSALRAEPWRASNAHRRTRPTTVELPLMRDALPGERGTLTRDVPISYAQDNRVYRWREVVRDKPVLLENPEGTEPRDAFFEAVLSA